MYPILPGAHGYSTIYYLYIAVAQPTPYLLSFYRDKRYMPNFISFSKPRCNRFSTPILNISVTYYAKILFSFQAHNVHTLLLLFILRFYTFETCKYFKYHLPKSFSCIYFSLHTILPHSTM